MRMSSRRASSSRSSNKIRKNFAKLTEALEPRFLLAGYFVSPAGNDANAGTQASPWKTVAKVNATNFQPGDVISFQRGGVWAESLKATSDGTANSPITYNAYGDANSPKPKFLGSDVLTNASFTKVAGTNSTWKYVLPSVIDRHTGIAIDHVIVPWVVGFGESEAAMIQKVDTTPGGYWVDDGFSTTPGNHALYLNTNGVDPTSNGKVYTIATRQNMVMNNFHSNLVFQNLWVDETMMLEVGWAYRFDGGNNVKILDCDATRVGAIHFGVVDGHNYLFQGNYAAYAMPLNFTRNAAYFVNSSQQGAAGASAQFIDNVAEHLENANSANYDAFSVLAGTVTIKNLTAVGFGGAGFNVGGSPDLKIIDCTIDNANSNIFSNNIFIDGLKSFNNTGGKIDVWGNNNIIQNSVIQSTNGEGSLISRGSGNVFRFNTLIRNSGTAINLKGSASGTQIIGNVFTGSANPLNNEGAAGTTLDYNFADNTAGAVNGLGGDTHLTLGDPKFVNKGTNDYSLQAGSAAIDKSNPAFTPAGFAMATGDAVGLPRKVGTSIDPGAFEFQGGAGNLPPTIGSLSDSPDPVTVPNPITLTANNVADADGTIVSVSFYVESNNVAGLQTGAGGDTLISTDTTPGPYSAQYNTTGLANGTYTFYAQAKDNGNAVSTPVSTTTTVTGGVAGPQYYVSPNGNDNNNGTSPATPWKTAAKVNSFAFAPGSTIFFQRGGEWREQLLPGVSGTLAQPITFDAYGDANLSKPIFSGSDVIPTNAWTAVGGGVYSFPASAVGGSVYWVYANHQMLQARNSNVNMPANTFAIIGGTIYANTGTNPASDGKLYTAGVRGQGNDQTAGVINSNAKDNLVFNNLIARETSDARDGIFDGNGNLSTFSRDGYGFRVMFSSNIKINNSEAYSGGKHHFGVINATGFVGTNLYSATVAQGLAFGNASAYVSYSDGGRSDTSQWIDCKVENYSGQPSFLTHGPGIASILVEDLQSLGSPIGVFQDNPSAQIVFKGGLLTGGQFDVFGSNVLIDGMTLGTGGSKIDLWGNNNIVQNVVVNGSTNGEGAIVVRGTGNTIRFSTLSLNPAGGFNIDIKNTGANTKVIGNIFTGSNKAVNNGGASGLVTDYNVFDTAFGTPQGLAGDTHLGSGNPLFTNPGAGNFAIQTGSLAIDKVPTAGITGIAGDFLRATRPAGAAFDAGAYEFQGGGGGNQVPILDTFTATPSPVIKPGAVTLTATAHDTDGTIASISFFVESNGTPGLQTGAGGDTALFTDTTSPFTFSAPTNAVAPGTYTVYARARDNEGANSAPMSKQVIVQAAGGGGGNTYYVSPNGNDNNNGTDPSTPWKTIAKVNATTFTPGAQILFQRGGEWREQLIANSSGAEGNPITYGDYGNAALAKPTFWGSDIIANNTFVAAGGSVYTVPANQINPSGTVNWVFANHQYLTKAANAGAVNSTPNSFFLDGATLRINTGGSNPATSGIVYTAASRQDVIASASQNNLVFKNIIGSETAASDQGLVFRIDHSSNLQMIDVEAINGGLRSIGVINSTNVTITRALASGGVPGLSFGQAIAFFDFSDGSRVGDTSQWIDCKVVNYAPGQLAFYTLGAGKGATLLQNFTTLGSPIAISTDAPTPANVTVKGGSYVNSNIDVYGSNVVIDGIELSGGDAKIALFGNNNTVQNSLIKQTHQDGGVIVMGNGNLVRFNTLQMQSFAPSAIHITTTAASTQLYGNMITGTTHAIRAAGAAGSFTSNHNYFDNTLGAPEFYLGANTSTLAQWQAAGKDAASAAGNPLFANAAILDFYLQAGSPAVDKVPTAGITGITTDFLGNPRLVGATYDIGAFERGATAPASIAGNVWNDPNSNGIKDDGETDLVGWQVYLDVNNNARADAGEPSQLTDGIGNYFFTGLDAGTYRVRQVLSSGYRKTLPGTGVPGYDVVLAAGGSSTARNFGNTTNILLAGKVFNDANNNGVQDAGEAGIAGVTVNIRSNNVTVATRTTDANGAWQVRGLAAGTGEAVVVLPSGFVSTSPAGGKYTGSMSSGQQNANLNFGLRQAAPAPLFAQSMIAMLDGADVDDLIAAVM